MDGRKLSKAGAAMVAAHRARVRMAARDEARTWTTDDVRALMNSADDLGLVGMEWNAEGGFAVERKVVATEPWRPSLVRLGERPRVALSVITRKCDHCHEPYAARRQSSRYCGATCRQSAKRAR